MGARPFDLTPKQQAFVDAYTGEAKGNGTLAAKIAGYDGTDASLASVASDLLRNAKVYAAIMEATESDRSRKIASRREIKETLTKVLRGEETEEVVLTVGIGNGFSQVERVRDKGVSLKERVKAAELLAKIYGMLIDRMEVKGPDWLKSTLAPISRRVASGEFDGVTVRDFWGTFLRLLGGDVDGGK